MSEQKPKRAWLILFALVVVGLIAFNIGMAVNNPYTRAGWLLAAAGLAAGLLAVGLGIKVTRR